MTKKLAEKNAKKENKTARGNVPELLCLNKLNTLSYFTTFLPLMM